MKKNTFKLIMDFLMVGLAVLLFKKNVLGLKFHEIAGIVFCTVIIFHLLLNK